MVFASRDIVVPLTGKRASDYAVGESVFLNVNGVSTEFLVVNQGIPSASSLYDSSCDGTWLLMKDIYENRAWHSSAVNDYANSTIHSYLNSTFLSLFDSNVQAAIKQVKIPYVNGTGGSAIASGADGLSTKIFLLAGFEIFTAKYTNMPVDGAILSYFTSTSNRIAYLNGTATYWWLRSPKIDVTTSAWLGNPSGAASYVSCTGSYGVRPALVLPYHTVFEYGTEKFKGVAA